MAAIGATTAFRPGIRGVAATVLTIATVSAMTAFAPAATAATTTALFTWGDNSYGQLGIGTAPARTQPGAGPAYSDVTSISGGRENVLAVRADGSVVSWGRNDYGQVGNGTTTNQKTPVVLALPPVTQVFTGHYHSMALTASGTLYAWGDNETGQLGIGNETSQSSPVQVPVGAPLASADGGADQTIALGTDGTVWTWGDSTYGEGGDNTTTTRTSPVHLTSLSNVVLVSAARDSDYAVTSSGALYAWGRNNEGQLGLGDTKNRKVPTLVPGISPVVGISAGAFHAVAILADGTVRAWGENDYGAVGDGTTTNRLTPVVVSGLSGAKYVETGRDSSYVVTSDGVLHAWGRNDTGQLGDGTKTNRLTPVTIAGVTGVTSLAAGRDYAAALVSTGPDTTPPTVPGTPTAVSNSPGTVTVTWAASTDDRATTIIYSVFRDGGSTAIGTVSSASTTTVSYTDTGLTGGSTHTYQVSASDGTNSSDLSPVSNLVTVESPDTQPPTVPGTPTAVSNSPGTVTVTWAASTDNVATTIIYSVFRDGGSTAIGTVSSASTTTVSYTDTGLTGGSTHTYQVSASDGTNSSDLSPVSNLVTVDSGPPAVFSSDFSNGLTGWTSVNMTVDNTNFPPDGAAPSIRGSTSGAVQWATHTLGGSYSSLCASADVDLTSLTSASAPLLRFLAGSTGVARVIVTSAGVIEIRADGSGQTFKSKTTLPAGNWHNVQLCSTVGTAATISAWLDGTKALTATSSTGTAPITTLQVGDTSAVTMTVNYDDVLVVTN